MISEQIRENKTNFLDVNALRSSCFAEPAKFEFFWHFSSPGSSMKEDIKYLQPAISERKRFSTPFEILSSRFFKT